MVETVQKWPISETEKKRKETNNKIAIGLEGYLCDWERILEDPTEFLSVWRTARTCMLNS